MAPIIYDTQSCNEYGKETKEEEHKGNRYLWRTYKKEFSELLWRKVESSDKTED